MCLHLSHSPMHAARVTCELASVKCTNSLILPDIHSLNYHCSLGHDDSALETLLLLVVEVAVVVVVVIVVFVLLLLLLLLL